MELAATKNEEEEEAELELRFTGEEAFGKYLDLHAQHELFLNLAPPKGEDDEAEGRRLTYLDYLAEFDKFDGISKTIKSKAAYEKCDAGEVCSGFPLISDHRNLFFSGTWFRFANTWKTGFRGHSRSSTWMP